MVGVEVYIIIVVQRQDAFLMTTVRLYNSWAEIIRWFLIVRISNCNFSLWICKHMHTHTKI